MWFQIRAENLQTPDSWEAGMNDYVAKPTDIKKLFSTLARWVNIETGSWKLETGKLELETGKLETGKLETGKLETGKLELGTENTDSRFPETLPGIDIRSGLERLGENEELFGRILLEFAEDFRDAVYNIRETLAKGDAEDAQCLAHTLKGVSGNCSAKNLHAATEMLEMRIRSGDTEGLDALMDDCEKALRQVLESVEHLRADWEEPENEDDSISDAAAMSEADISCLSPKFVELAGYLQNNDVKALDCIGWIKSQLKLNKEIKKLDEQINKFDFRNARKSLTAIAEEWGIEITEP